MKLCEVSLVNNRGKHYSCLFYSLCYNGFLIVVAVHNETNTSI